MQTWIEQMMGVAEPSAVLLPAAFLVGVLGAVSSCCNLGVIGAIAGYSGSSDVRSPKSNAVANVSFSSPRSSSGGSIVNE